MPNPSTLASAQERPEPETSFDWKKHFAKYDRRTIDDQGKVVSYLNSLDELYQAFIGRMLAEKYIIRGNK